MNISRVQDALSPGPLRKREELDRYYTETSEARTGDKYSDFVKSLGLALKNCESTQIHRLFIGHSGCGKTTELFRLTECLERERFSVCMGRCDYDLDSADIEYTDILFYMLDLLLEKAEQRALDVNSELIQDINDYWKSQKEIVDTISKAKELSTSGEVSGKVNLLTVINIMTAIKGVIKNGNESRTVIRRSIDPKSSELISYINRVLRDISEQLRARGEKYPIVFIIDGLDKIPLEQARKIFRENGAKFASLECHLIVTFPIAITYLPEYTDIQTWFPDSDRLPMIKIKKWNGTAYDNGYKEGIDTLKNIIAKRIDLNLFETDDALEVIIEKTGGDIRQLFSCISTAAIRAQLRGADTICKEDSDNALKKLKTAINARYGEEQLKTLNAIYCGDKYLNSNDDTIKLLQSGAILEYNGQRWVDLHPLVEEWLLEHNKIGNGRCSQ